MLIKSVERWKWRSGLGSPLENGPSGSADTKGVQRDSMENPNRDQFRIHFRKQSQLGPSKLSIGFLGQGCIEFEVGILLPIITNRGKTCEERAAGSGTMRYPSPLQRFLG